MTLSYTVVKDGVSFNIRAIKDGVQLESLFKDINLIEFVLPLSYIERVKGLTMERKITICMNNMVTTTLQYSRMQDDNCKCIERVIGSMR